MSEDIFQDSDLIYSYSRKEAIEDGSQFEISKEIVKDAGFVYPIFVTEPIYNIIEAATKQNKFKDCTGIIWDILTVLRFEIKMQPDKNPIKFVVNIGGKAHELYSQVGPLDIDDPSPAITIMTEMDF